MLSSASNENPLTAAVNQLASIAEAFRKIEMVFGTIESNRPLLHKLCLAFLSGKQCDEVVKLLPSSKPHRQFTDIRYAFDSKTSRWESTKTEFTIDEMKIQERIRGFQEFIQTADKSIVQSYLKRQEAYYSPETKSANLVEETKSDASTSERVALAKLLKKYRPVISGSVAEASSTIQKIVVNHTTQAFNSPNISMNDMWQNIAVSVFVGRDLLSNAKALNLNADLDAMIKICFQLSAAKTAELKSRKEKISDKDSVSGNVLPASGMFKFVTISETVKAEFTPPADFKITEMEYNYLMMCRQQMKPSK